MSLDPRRRGQLAPLYPKEEHRAIKVWISDTPKSIHFSTHFSDNRHGINTSHTSSSIPFSPASTNTRPVPRPGQFSNPGAAGELKVASRRDTHCRLCTSIVRIFLLHPTDQLPRRGITRTGKGSAGQMHLPLDSIVVVFFHRVFSGTRYGCGLVRLRITLVQ